MPHRKDPPRLRSEAPGMLQNMPQARRRQSDQSRPRRPASEPVVDPVGKNGRCSEKHDHAHDGSEALGVEREGTEGDGVHRRALLAADADVVTVSALISPTSLLSAISSLLPSRNSIVGGPTT